MARSGGRTVTPGSWKMIKWFLAIALIVLVLQDLPSAEAKKGSRRCLVRLCKMCKRYHYTGGRNRRSVNNETALLGDGKEAFDIDDTTGFDMVSPADDGSDEMLDDDDEEPASIKESRVEALKQLLVRRKLYQRRRIHAMKQCSAYRRWRQNFHHARPLYNGTTTNNNDQEDADHPGSKMNGSACMWLRRQAALYKYYKQEAGLATSSSASSSVSSEGQQQKRSTNSHRMRCMKVIQSWCCRRYFEVYLIGYRYKS